MRFKATLGSEDGKDLFIEVPFDVKAKFGKARLPVKITIKGFTFESTTAVYGGKYYLPIRKDRRDVTGVSAGDVVDVTLEPDTSTRTVEPPAELSTLFAKNAKAKAAWEKLSYSHRLEHAKAIEEAKKPETRARRAQKAIEMLLGKS